MTQITVPTPGTVLQGPIYSIFEPQLQLISSVSNSVNAVVVTVADHGYTTGMVVRVIVPKTYGMQLYAQTTIEVLSANSFKTQLNTTGIDPFVAPTLYPPVAYTPAQTIPMTGTEDNVA